MKKKSTSQSAFFSLRVLIGVFFFLAGVFLALLGFGTFSKASAQSNASVQNQPPSGPPTVVPMVGPVALNMDLRKLPYIAPKEEFEERVLTRYPHGTGQTGASAGYGISGLAKVQQLVKNLWRPAPNMPPPLLTFEGESAAQACACAPPDSDGDVGPNHYIEAINVAFKIFDKNGNTLAGPTTYNSLFAPLTGTPCSSQNDGDPYALYDPVADRWVISDFAFPSFPGTSFYQCIAVSQTSDPVSGGWFLYALQVDPGNPSFLGDYPKFGFWNNPQPGGAYFLTMNLFSSPTTFNGVRAYALDRASMLTGGPAHAIGFTIPIAGLGDSYSLVASTFRTGNSPPAGRDEMLLAIDSPATGGVTLTQVHGWLFHVDFITPANSTLGIGTNHTPNAQITVTGFVDAFTSAAGFTIVPQQGTTRKVDTLGDKIMTPVVYQNRTGTESLWASGTVCTDVNCTGPTGVRWYQFNVTGGTFPATPVQQQTWTNGNDGLYRFMPSIAVDNAGNTAIGYSTSSSTIFPGISYAGRLATDPIGNLGQGEATMFSGTGSESDTNGRWGDYSMTTIDPADGMTFWHVNEYEATTGSFNWHTRIGKFAFGGGPPTPTFNNLIVNAGFETGSFSPWVIDGVNNSPVVTTAQAHSGTHSALLGTVSGLEPLGDSSFYQQFTVPAAGGTLSFWHWDFTTDNIAYDWQDVYVTNTSGTILATISHTCANTSDWVHKTFDMTPYAGQTVRIKFLVHQDGFGDLTSMYVDDVELIWPNANYVLYNASTRATRVWRLNNNVHVGSASGPTLQAGWSLVGAADFNGSLNPDYLLFNASTGNSNIWYLSGTTKVTTASGPTIPSGWVLMTTADFNGDGHPDYVLYNTSTRKTQIWYLNNNVFLSSANGPTLPAGWSLVGAADFNGDLNPDYLLFNASTGKSKIWYLSGTTKVTTASGPTIPSGWVLVTMADFNGDGHPDYVLYEPATRKTAIWYLNNNVFVSSASGPTLPAGWSLVDALPSVP
ncbi:MAG TPA: hypothetical protein DIT76_05970 [Spartobacteria bacterium]|jgi:hypothetical protein|nr:hypothetical protein [Spartobacteria bacterium]